MLLNCNKHVEIPAKTAVDETKPSEIQQLWLVLNWMSLLYVETGHKCFIRMHEGIGVKKKKQLFLLYLALGRLRLEQTIFNFHVMLYKEKKLGKRSEENSN